MGAAREPDQADFDLDRFIDMFDEAMMSQDPRVIETLRKLMMIVVLTRPEVPAQGYDGGRKTGPLRRMHEDLNHLNNRMHRMDEEIRSLASRTHQAESYSKRYGFVEERTLADEKISWEQVAAKQMASQIDADVLKNLSRKINGGYTLGPETSIKGLKDA